MLIKCPYCGPRDVAEFSIAGEISARPHFESDFDSAPAREAFVEAVYLRDNPAGLHHEYWFHAFGCQAWLVVARDTRTHVVASVDIAQAKETSS